MYIPVDAGGHVWGLGHAEREGRGGEWVGGNINMCLNIHIYIDNHDNYIPVHAGGHVWGLCHAEGEGRHICILVFYTFNS